MATLSAGYVYGASETVTNAKLAALVNNGSVSGITQADLTSGIGTIATQGSAPSDTDSLWLDTSFSPYTLKFYNGSAWVPVARWGQLLNNTAQSATAGMVVVIDSDGTNSFEFTSTEGNNAAPSIVIGTIAASAQGFVVDNAEGITCLLEVSASAGSFIRTSTATGKSTPIGSLAAGVFGIVTGAGTASATCKLFGIAGAGASVSDNNIWTGTNTFNGNVTLNAVTTLTTASASTTNWKPVVQMVKTEYATYASLGTTTIPLDDSTPEWDEGNEISGLATTITPKHANNRLKITVTACLSQAGSDRIGYLCLFQDPTGSDAAKQVWGNLCSDASPNFITGVYEQIAGTTASTTFKFRAGDATGNNFVINGKAAATAGRIYGGSIKSYVVIEEIKA